MISSNNSGALRSTKAVGASNKKGAKVQLAASQMVTPVKSEAAMKVVKPSKVEDVTPKATPKPEAVQARFSVAERVEKLALINGLAEKRVAYKSKLAELDRFICSKDEFAYSVTLNNPNGDDVAVKRLDVCEEIIAILKEKVADSLAKVEKQIETFEI